MLVPPRYLKKILFPKLYLKRKYRKKLNRIPDLGNPRRFTELMQWRKLYDHNPLYTLCSDKFAVRGYIKDKMGVEVLVPLIRSARTWEELDFPSLPESFIIKANHGCGWNEIVFDKSKVREKDLKQVCEKWLSQNYYHRSAEWQYKNIPPMIVVEKLLLDQNGRAPEDYKCHCYNITGETDMVISVNENRFVDHRRSAYDENWNRLPFSTHVRAPDRDCPRPEKLKDMVRLAKKLAEDFNYVRVDLYNLSGKLYFAELTFTPDSGFGLYNPDKWDYILGEKALKAGIKEG